MKIKSIVLIMFLFISGIYGQQMSVLQRNIDVVNYHKVPQEKIFIHYNSSLLFTGEHLYYRLYCFNDKNNLLTTISKIAYVAMINEKGEAIFKHKIKLNNGVGQGDFFVPVTVPSGNYKIIGYTQWMLNVKHHYFEGDISILNPYQENQDIVSKQKVNDLSVNLVKQGNLNESQNQYKQNISIDLDKKVYQKRSQVTLTIEDFLLHKEPGTYSISVRRKDAFSKAIQTTTKDFNTTLDKGNVKRQNVSSGSSVFLPEMRGELIYGKILSTDNQNEVANKNIGLSIPGNTKGIHVVSTNDNGEFVFNLPERESENNMMLVEVLGEDKDAFKVMVHDMPNAAYPKLDFYQFKISPSLKDSIIRRSVYNQIENNFYAVKPDSIVEVNKELPFYGKVMNTYNLDDYTRFATVKETVVEVIDGMWTTKDTKGNEVFGIRSYYPDQDDSQFLPLLLVDGVMEQDHGKLINFDARKIKSIGFIRDRYYLGSHIFEGIVILETLKMDYTETKDANYVASVEFSPLQGAKKYFKQRYTDAISYDRIPDYRNQLLWMPNLKMINKKETVDFFTSDVSGTYEISLEGFGNKGTPGSIKKTFVVK